MWVDFGRCIWAIALGIVMATLPIAEQTPLWIAPAEIDSAAAGMPFWVWIAAPGEAEPTTAAAPVGKVWMARGWEAPDDAGHWSARLFLAADNHAVAYLNGDEVLRTDSWSAPAVAEVKLRPGGNTLALQAENDEGTGTNPAGVVALLEARGSDGRVFRLITDESWRGATTTWEGWPSAAAPATSAAVTVLGPASSEPWKLSAAAFTRPRPCPILRKRFVLEDRPARGTVRIIGLGHYELRLNGRVVGDTLINQAWSQYDRMIYWQEFDVSALLREGENVFGVGLGNSFWHVAPPNDARRFAKTDAMPVFSPEPYLLWFEARIETEGPHSQPLSQGERGAEGPHPQPLSQGERGAAGERVVISDDSWRWSDGPLTFSHIYAGEDYDATREQPGWDRPGFDDANWRAVRVVAAPPAALDRLPGPGIQAFEVFQPREIREPAPGTYTYVFPQNCSALLRFTLDGPRGRTVRFKPCEYMDATGRVRFTYTWGTGKDIWHDYTLRGGGPETHQIQFCYVGCQYVEVSGAVPADHANPDGLPVITKLELVHTRAANRSVGEFASSSDLQNGAQRLIDWSIRSNMSHVATDCPHREKNGWQEQNWHMARSLSYGYDVRDWFRKIAHDLRDTQLADGHIPTNCPNYLVGVPPHGFWNEAPEWGIAGVLVPWHLYEWYGDRETLAASFGSMQRYVDYLASQAQDGVIRSNLGDWYDFGHGKGDGPSRWTPSEVSATAIWALGAATVSRAAEILSRPAEAERYATMFDGVRADFQRHFYDAATHTVKNNGSCQAANSAALCIGLVPEPDRPAVAHAIVADLEQRDWQQTTGEVLHVFLIRALAEAGHGDVLHKVYAREEPGSYGYMVRRGLTTLPESWDAKPGTGNSMNHFMLGQLSEWHFAYVAGIRQQPGGVGWRKILIAPDPGPLEHAGAAFDSPAGRIESRWRVEHGVFEMTVQIPNDVEALAILPDGTRQPLTAGRSTIHCAHPKDQ